MLSRLVPSRGYAAAASAARSNLATPGDAKVSRLSNGLTVGSIDNAGPVSHLVVAYRAGTRYEQPSQAGLVHHLQHAIGTDSQRYLGVKLLWQTGSIGGTLASSATRELLIVQLSALRNHAPIALSLLGEFAQPAVKPWDVDDTIPSLKAGLAAVDPEQLVLELLHRGAFRNGALANSTISPVYQAGKVSNSQLSAFAKNRLVTGEAAVVGINVDHGILLQYGNEQSSIPTGNGSAAAASPYIGGDARQATGSALAHVAIAGAGAGLQDAAGVAVQNVLSAAIGAGPATTYSPHSGNGAVTNAVLRAANTNPVGIAPINVNHSDSGLVGVLLVANGSKIESYVKAAVEGLKSLASTGLSADALLVAQRTAALNVLLRGENASTTAVDRAAQLLANGAAATPAEVAEQVAKVSAEDVKKAAQKLVSKLSVGAVGNVATVPYADQL